MRRKLISIASAFLVACGDDAASTRAPEDAGATGPDAAAVSPSSSIAGPIDASPSGSPSVSPSAPASPGGLPSPLSVLTTREVVEVLPADLRKTLIGCWKLELGEEWRFSARGKEGLSLTQKLPESYPHYLKDPKPVVVKFSAEERSFAFTSVGGHHPCLVACVVSADELHCSSACSRRPGDGFPVRAGRPVAVRCSAKP